MDITEMSWADIAEACIDLVDGEAPGGAFESWGDLSLFLTKWAQTAACEGQGEASEIIRSCADIAVAQHLRAQ